MSTKIVVAYILESTLFTTIDSKFQIKSKFGVFNQKQIKKNTKPKKKERKNLNKKTKRTTNKMAKISLNLTPTTSKHKSSNGCKYGAFWLALTIALMWPELITALTNIKITVPRAVKRGGNAILICNYDMEEARLYSIKWYKGKKEFFRFMPNEVPNVKVFPHSNLKIETMLSNQTHLLLQDMQPENSGKYTCEISMDAPDFTTAMITGELEVVELPKEQATVTGIHPRYRIGDLVDGNCSIKFSKPAANLTWTINGYVVPPHHIKTYQIEKHENSSLESVMSALNFMATTQHFINGKMRLKCTASIFDIFKNEIESIIEEDRPRIMASGQSYDMHNYPYEQQHTSGDGFEDHNESYLTYYSAADTTSGSSSTLPALKASTLIRRMIQKLKSQFQRCGLKFSALAKKLQEQLTNGFAPLSGASTKMQLSFQADERAQTMLRMAMATATATAPVTETAIAGHVKGHEKIHTKSEWCSWTSVCYCIAALTIILTHHFMSCQNTKTTTKATTMEMEFTMAMELALMAAKSSVGSNGNNNKSFYNCPEKSVQAPKCTSKKWQTSMAVQRQPSDCQCDDNNIDDDDDDDGVAAAIDSNNADCRIEQQKCEQMHLQLKEHIQVQHELIMTTLLMIAFIESTAHNIDIEIQRCNDNNNSDATITTTLEQPSLLSLSKDQTLLMTALCMIGVQQFRLHQLFAVIPDDATVAAMPNSSTQTRKISNEFFQYFPKLLSAAPLIPSTQCPWHIRASPLLFHHNQRQRAYC